MDLVIDPKIRDWVLIPIVVVMFHVGVFRFYLNQYMNYNKVREPANKAQVKEHGKKNIVAFCQKLVGGFMILPEYSFRMRKSFFCKKPNGALYKVDPAAANSPMGGNMMMNPSMMTDMLKNNLSMAVSTMLQFAWISFFFSGFVLAKVPFSLTQKFKSMLQKGVEIQNLDVKYISSLSLYFLILFGLNGLNSLILSSKDDEEDFSQSNAMAAQMGMPAGGMGMGGGPGQAPDYNKVFTAERENIELLKHEFLPPNYESIAIEKLRNQLNDE
jgi:hypothetical protein